MAEINTYDNYPKIISYEGKTMILVAEVMNSSQLTKSELQSFHKYLVNHEIRWRHQIPEANPDAILGVWIETFETDWKGKSRMFAKGKIFGETEAQQKAQALLIKWEEEGKKFGVSSQTWKLSDKNDKTVAILFREASLTPYPKIEDCLVYRIYEDTDVGKPLSKIVNEIKLSEKPIEGVEILKSEDISANSGAPLVININIGSDGASIDNGYAQAIQEADAAIQKLKSLGGGIGGGSALAAEPQQEAEPAPAPEEYVEMKGQTVPQEQGQEQGREQVQERPIGNDQGSQDDEDEITKKNKQRQKLNAFEVENMNEKTKNVDDKLTISKYELELKEKEVVDLRAKVDSFESKLSDHEDKVKEYEVAMEAAKVKVASFETERKTLTGKVSAVIKENDGLKAKITEFGLYPKRWKLSKLAGNKTEESIKAYFNEISDFSEKQLDVTISALEKKIETEKDEDEDDEDKDKAPSLDMNESTFIGEMSLPSLKSGKADNEFYEDLSKKFAGDPAGFLKAASIPVKIN